MAMKISRPASGGAMRNDVIEYVAVGCDVLEIYEDGTRVCFSTHCALAGAPSARAEEVANQLNERMRTREEIEMATENERQLELDHSENDRKRLDPCLVIVAEASSRPRGGLSPAAELKRLRQLLQLTQCELAHALDVSTRQVSRWEAADGTPPRTVFLSLRFLLERAG